MKNEVGRNDICPCMSGKKYKKCCEKNKEFVKYLKENLNSQYIDSEYMINNLCQGSDLLSKYIIDKIPLLNRPLLWLFNPELDANMRSIEIEDIHGIIVKAIPVQTKDYFDIAHEIGHLILGEQGYPATRPKDNDLRKMYLGVASTNTIMDPKINQGLIDYGFNFIEYLNKSISMQMRIFEDYPMESSLNLFDRHFIKCLLIEKILEWDLLQENVINPFEEKCKEKYPQIYLDILEEIKFIKEIGTDTPEKVIIIIKRILDNNEMSNIIEIV